MKAKYLVIFPIFILQLLSESYAQFVIDAQYRNRLEIRDGYKQMVQDGSSPAFFISQRTRISLKYKTDFIDINFTPQDVRLWGDEKVASSTGVYGDQASLDLFEGWIELKPSKQFRLSLGRQQLIYDNQRILAARNWNQMGLSYDALLLKMELKNWNIHIAGSWNTLFETLIENYYPTDRLKTLNFLWINKKIKDNIDISFTHIASGVTKTDTTNTLFFRQTSGIYFRFEKNDIVFWGDAYYQFGKNKIGKNVSAFLIDADISFNPGMFTGGLGFSYLSGNSKTGEEQHTDNLFDVLYGARHKYFGSMDYFRNFSSDTRQGGLVDYYFYVGFKISKSVSIKNTGHYFQLAQSNPTTSSNKNLAYENDLIFKYEFKKWGALESGYCFMLPTESLKELQGVKDEKFPQFFYVQLTVKPTLFIHPSHNKM